MNFASHSTLSNYKIIPEVLTDLSRHHFILHKKYAVSIYALDLAIIDRIDHVIDFVIGHYGNNRLNETLNAKTGQYLTPLHIATIMGREDVVQKLIKAGADVNVQDKRSWSSLHHAALAGNRVIINLLIAAGADEKALSDTNGTYQSLLKLRETGIKTIERIPLLWRESDNASCMLTCEQFEKLTKATYRSENYASSDYLIQAWHTPETQIFPFRRIEELLRRLYPRFKSNPPQHILSQITINDAD